MVRFPPAFLNGDKGGGNSQEWRCNRCATKKRNIRLLHLYKYTLRCIHRNQDVKHTRPDAQAPGFPLLTPDILCSARAELEVRAIRPARTSNFSPVTAQAICQAIAMPGVSAYWDFHEHASHSVPGLVARLQIAARTRMRVDQNDWPQRVSGRPFSYGVPPAPGAAE